MRPRDDNARYTNKIYNTIIHKTATDPVQDNNYNLKRKLSPKQQMSRIPMSFLGSFLALVLVLNLQSPATRCEAKEFDWSDLGVSLSSSKSHSPQNNLRILVSPQRRMTKGYDYEYVNSNQTSGSGSQPESTSYVVPSSAGSTYLSSAPSHSSQSAAYSALSASLATLKNRLSARGVTLSQTLSDNGSSLYPTGNYGSLVEQAQQGQQSAQHGSPDQSQPTYLSVANQQDSQTSAGQYTLPPAQSSDNKTIVLAIPAKINFLTDSRVSSGQKQQATYQQQQNNQQAQQVTVVQSPNDPQTRQEYGTKIDTSDQTRTQLVGDSNQEHPGQQHYVIVNQPSSGQSNDPHSHLVAANLSPSSPGTQAQMYSPLYQQSQPAQMGSFAMKYIPTYQTAAIHQPTVQKLYGQVIESPVTTNSFDNPNDVGMGRYMSCLDTCNSADPRWRKYTVSKYKACCSRSSLYDASFEQPSSEKVGEMGSKYNEDAYYNYLYRRSRARRTRRLRNRYSKSHPPVGSSTSDDDAGAADEAPTKHSSGRQSHHSEPPHSRFYKIRQSASSMNEDGHLNGESVPMPGAKYGKDRSYKRGGRSRDLDSSLDAPSSGSSDSFDEEPVYPSGRGSSGYGSSEHSIESGRYQSEGRHQSSDEEEARPTYDDPSDSDKSFTADSADYQVDTASEANQGEDQEQPEQQVSSKAPSTLRKRKPSTKARSMRERKIEKEAKSLRKSRKGSSKQTKSDSYATSQSNASNDNEPTQASADQQQTHESNGGDEEPIYQREVGSDGITDSEKDSQVTKYKPTMNDTAVANLSKTTMHLKEILSLLEKKAQLRANETSYSSQQATSTSTPAPTTTTTTTTTLYSHSYLGGAPLSLQPTEYMTAELSLKSPYRLEAPSMASSLGSPSLPMAASYASLNSDSYSSPYSHSQYSLPPKHMSMQNMHHSRKRRIPKNTRYNHMMYPKTHGYGQSSGLMHSPSIKNPLSSPAYYTSVQYPYLYGRGSSSSSMSSYPYKSMHKNHLYSSALHGPTQTKFSQSGLYSDNTRSYGLSSYDPLANVASVLRPSTMRLRSKPFLFHSPQHLYARQTILTQPVDAKK